MFYGWWVVAAAWAATFGSVAFFNPVMGVFVQPLQEEFGWGRSQVALAVSAGGLLAGVLAPFAGAAIDRWGGRWVIGGAAIVMTVCALLLAQIQALWQLLVIYAIRRAVAVGGMTPASFVAIANWFVRRRALVAGIVAIAPRLGMGVTPLVVAVVIGATGEWRSGWLVLACLALASGVPALLFMRRRPEDLGLRPDGDDDPRDLRSLPVVPLDRDFTVREAVRTPAYWFVGLMVSCVMFAGGAINFHQIPHLIDRGLPPTQAALIVAVFSAAGAGGAVIGGSVATRITMRWTMVPSLVGMAAGVVLLLNVTSMTSALVYAVCYGVFFGSQTTLDQVIHADYFGRRALGSIRGSFQPVALAMNAAGPFLAGLWYDGTGSYAGPFLLFSALFLLAALAMAFARYPPAPERGRGLAR